MALPASTMVQAVFMLTLFLLFLALFGVSSLRKFLRQEVTTVTSLQANTVGNILPAVTVCANYQGENCCLSGHRHSISNRKLFCYLSFIIAIWYTRIHPLWNSGGRR